MTIFVTVACLAIGRTAAMSALLAGLSCIAPTVFVLLVSLRQVQPGDTGLGLVLKGEAGKFGLTIALLAVIFVSVEMLNVAAFFGTFVLMQVCQAVVHFIEANRLMRKSLP